MLTLLQVHKRQSVCTEKDTRCEDIHVDCFGVNGLLRQYFSKYRAVFQRGRKKKEKIDDRKMSKQPPPAPAATKSHALLLSRLGRGPSTENLLSTIALPDRP